MEVKEIEDNIDKIDLSKEIKKIEKLDSKKIEWYDLKNEVKKIKPKLTEEEEGILLYEFQKKFKEDNSLVKLHDKDIVIFKVLEELILKDGLNVGRKDLVSKKYYVSIGIDNAVTKALKVLELYKIISKQQIGLNNEKGYSLNLDKWFKKSRYKIQDYIVLERLAPIVSSFINIGFIDEFNIEKLFDRLSDIIEYAILPSALHNKFLDIENIITTAIIDKEEISILIYDKEKRIKPIKIVFRNGSKYVVFKDGNITDRVELYQCDLIEKEDYFNYLNVNQSNLQVHNDVIKQVQTPKEKKLLLECDSVMYEYFKMLPLSNMIIYDEEEKQKEFMIKYNYDCMPNKFYIEAFDYKEKIISVIFHCIENVKIIEPTSLNEDIAERMKTFAKKNNIDLCKEDTPPTKPTPQKPNEEKDINKNIEIDKTDLVKNIKKDGGGNLNL